MSHANKYKKFKKFHHKPNIVREKAPQLEEKDVGITEYVSDSEGFSGIIKARYSDFQVNEIDLSGVEAKLTDRSIPKDFVIDTCDSSEATRPALISVEIWENLEKLVSDDPSNGPIEIDVTALTKDERSQIHNGVKRKFGQKIVASTVTKDDKKYIEFKKYDKSTREDLRDKWPTDKGEYVHFVVYKEALDTLVACYKISDCLRMRPSSFAYAGVKDKRAKTTQWFSVKKVLPWKLINQTNKLHSVKIGNLVFKDKPLKLGQLSGNRFRIALRNVVADDDVLEAAMLSLKAKGFVNYYGLQRFGNDRGVPTYLIGIKLLRGEFKEACDLILKLKMSDEPFSDTLEAKKVYNETRDAKKAFGKFDRNRNTCVESKLLEGLAKNGPNDYVNALENIPRSMRLLYIHAFQSLIWNKLVSKRVREFGLKPIEGDLVLLDENPEEIDDEKEDELFKDVKVLGKDDVENYTIFDVVLPLPGYDVLYPENEIKEWYKQALAEHDLTLEMSKQKVKTYNLSGSYRKICARIDNCSWHTLLYDDPNYNLIRSDWEELNGDEEPTSVPNGKFKALVLDFVLNSASYATMALREVLKTDTSTNAQSLLNDYHKSEVPDVPEISNSLLNDPDKLAAFKSAIFGDCTGVKRKIDSEDVETEEKLETSDKRIKTEASLI